MDDPGVRLCPRCLRLLAPVTDEHGEGSACAGCGGRAVPFGDLRTALPADTVVSLVHALRSAPRRGRRPCPGCSLGMVDVEAGGNGPSVVVAGCPACRLAWFDADGVRRLTPDPPARFRRGRAGPGDVAEVLGRYALSRRQDAVAESGIDLASRDGLSAWVGLPTLHGTPRIDARPWATYGLVAACVTTWAATLITGFVTRGFLGALDVQRAVIEAAGFIPAYAGRHAGLTWVTSTFVHAGMLHLVANMYALLLTGPHVEGRLGPWRFLGLFFAADVAGTTFDLMLHGASWVPRVGASGGIAGLFGYFVFAFPRVDVGTYVPNWRSGTRYSFTRIRVAVPWMFALWLWFEVLGILRGPQTRIAFAAHVGGALAGIGGWALARAVRRPGTIPPPVLPPIPRARDRRFPSAIPVTAPAAVGPAPPPPAGTATSESPHGFVLEPEAPRPSRAPPGEAPSPTSAATSQTAEPGPRAGAEGPPPPRAVAAPPRPDEWTLEEGIRDTVRSLARRSVRAAPLWAALALLILGFGATIPASAAVSQITFGIALASLAAGAPIGILLGRDLVEEVGFAGWIPAGLAMGASAVVVLVVGLLVGLVIPLEVPLFRALVPVMAAAGGAAGALKVTWAEN